MKIGVYDEYFNYLKQRSLKALLYRKFWLYPNLLKNIKGETLDVGCGIGDLLKYNPDIIGVDINPSAVNHCKNMGLKAQLMEKDKLPFKSQNFDNVILDNVLEHIKKPKPLLIEITRVLKKNGIFILGVPGLKGYAHDPDHKIFYSKEKLIELIKSHGFVHIKSFGMPLNFNWLSSKMRQFCIYGYFKKK